jgi:voltage-gated potassium channel
VRVITQELAAPGDLTRVGWRVQPTSARPAARRSTARAQALVIRLEPVVILAALLTIPLTVVEVKGQSGVAFTLTDWALWSIFVVDYAACLAAASDRRHYVAQDWLGLLVVVVSFPVLPAAFALVRASRLVRFIRVTRLIGISTRALSAIKATLGRRGVLYVAGVLLLLIAVAGALMSIVEPQTVKGDFWNGMWWAVVTSTTVGYGDIAPVTLLGRLISIALMVAGIGLMATLTASVAAYFVNEGQSEHDEVLAKLERIEALLGELKAR